MKEKQSYERPSTLFRERGAYLAPGERVYARTPAVLPPMAEDEMPNRLGLARWLVSPANPLTARVAVNRAWEQFFGRGLVETSEDFGTQGAATVPPGTPRLAGDRVRATAVEPEGAPPPDRHLGRVPAGRAGHASPAGEGSQQSPDRERAAIPDGGRDGARRHAGGRGTAQREDRRAQRLSRSAGRYLGQPVQRRQMGHESGRRPLSARALHVRAPNVAVSKLHDLRCDQPRALHGPASADEHAAAGADTSQRRGLDGGGTRAG